MWDAIVSVTHIWDDLVDKDREVSAEEVNAAFVQLFTDVGRNPFFRQYENELRPLFEQGIHDWQDSNDLLDEGLLELAFVLRGSISMVVIRSATIIGGSEWGRCVSMDLRRRLFDDFADFKAEHGG